MNNMLLRAITGGVFIAIVIACILHSVIALTMLLLVFGALCLWEYFSWYKTTYAPAFLSIARLLGLMVLGYGLLVLQVPSYLQYWPLLFLAFPLLAISTLFTPSGQFLSLTGKSLVGWFMITLPLFSIAALAEISFQTGFFYTMLFFATMWINDTGAYLSGRFFGKRPLFPRISPKKTWEGLIGGVLLSLIGAIVATFFLSSNTEALLFNIGFAIVVSIGGTFGDLVESALKRELGIKDSGKMLPGHGGILDRLDGVLLAAPLAFGYYYFCTLLIG
jgi:phosphatidate cytidylyltransferase